MTLAARLVDNKIRLHDGKVFLSEEADDTPCKCCASECPTEVTVEVTFCGFTATLQVPIPGSASFNQDLDGAGPGESYMLVEVQIQCGPCGWPLVIAVCAFCEETNQFASDVFTALIPFAAAEEPAGGYCPESGAVDLTCFGEQFGIPCVTTTTAEIA